MCFVRRVAKIMDWLRFIWVLQNLSERLLDMH